MFVGRYGLTAFAPPELRQETFGIPGHVTVVTLVWPISPLTILEVA
jgi:hypothetical protein